MGHTFSKDMDSVWKWLNRSHWGKLGGSGFNDAMANNMNDSSQLNQWSSGNPEEMDSSNESAYWWNRMKNALPNPSLKLPHLHQAEDPSNNQSSYDTALGDDRIGKLSFVHY